MISMINGNVDAIDFRPISHLIALGFLEATKPDGRVCQDMRYLEDVRAIMNSLVHVHGTPGPKQDIPHLVILPLADALLALDNDLRLHCVQTPKITAIREDLKLAAKFLDVFSMGILLGKSFENAPVTSSIPSEFSVN